VNTFLSSDQEALLTRYRAFVQEHVLPVSDALDEGNHSVRELFAALGQEGYLGASVAKEYGGQDGSFLNYVLLAEAIAEVEPGLALSLAAHAQVMELVSKFGTDKQKSRYLPLLARGECIGAFALNEENAGSDYSALQAKAVAKNGKVLISGQKTWVVNGSVANLFLIVAKFDKGEDKRLSIWLADVENKGSIKVGADRKKLGLRSAVTNDIVFAELELESDAYLGALDPATAADDLATNEAILQAFDVSKVTVAAGAIGLLTHALSASVDRAKSREQFGSNIGKLQAIQWKLADMSTESAAARLLTYRAGWSKDGAPEEFRKCAAMCKYFAAKTARVHSSEAVQIFGALGLSDDEPIEKMYRDAKTMEIAEGTSEIQKNVVAQQVGS
jgi:alkylation response protein AidB-like acyl-CoA dehydrogenase